MTTTDRLLRKNNALKLNSALRLCTRVVGFTQVTLAANEKFHGGYPWRI